MTLPFALFAQNGKEFVFEFGRRMESAGDWILPIAACVVFAWFVIGMYVLDCLELGGRKATLFVGLRLLAIAGMLLIYLQPQWRGKRDVVTNARALVLVDTSPSMAFPSETAANSNSGERRVDEIVKTFKNGELFSQLREKFDVLVYRFDGAERPVQLTHLRRDQKIAPLTVADQEKINRLRWLLLISAGILILGLVLIVWYLLRPAIEGRVPLSQLILGVTLVAVAIGLAGWSYFEDSDIPLARVIGIDTSAQSSAADVSTEDDAERKKDHDWEALLALRGTSTRIGQAIFEVIQQSRQDPVAAILLISDGGQNAGLDISQALEAARDNSIPIFSIGLGSPDALPKLKIDQFAAPERVHPEDGFSVKVYLATEGIEGKVHIQLNRIEADPAQPDAVQRDEMDGTDVTVTKNRDKDAQPLTVELTGEGVADPGRYRYELVVRPSDTEMADLSDRQLFDVEVIERPTNVLIISGGPGREYRFLRNLLFRDKERGTIVDVWLQNVDSEVAQDANRLLGAFPESQDELKQYDCIVAIDPDWRDLGPEQVRWLEEWVADKAGGMIVIPGGVFAGSAVESWLHDPAFAGLESLYPVEFQPSFLQFGEGYQTTSKPQPLELTPAGRVAEFLQFEDGGRGNDDVWQAFGGVYGKFKIRGTKPGAIVYAKYQAETFGDSRQENVFMAEQAFGAGRVIYLASAEMWRMRRVNEAYFEQFYTKLIRHAAQGRLPRGSNRGDVLILKKTNYNIGDTVRVQAELKNAQRGPLAAAQVTLFVFAPQNKSFRITMKSNEFRPGLFEGEFVVRQVGDYRLELPLAESQEAPLTKSISVETVDLEARHAVRNDELLLDLAKNSGKYEDGRGGRYIDGLNQIVQAQGSKSLSSQIEGEPRITTLYNDKPEPWWKEWFAKGMMLMVCGVLFLEWTLRRLNRLA